MDARQRTDKIPGRKVWWAEGRHGTFEYPVPEVSVSSVTPLEPISAFFERNLNIRTVYGEPVHEGETTIIPVAKVAFGFGAGGGRGLARGRLTPPSGSETGPTPDAQGGGGGGGARLSPIGALEIGPRGTRFIRYNQLPRLTGIFALGLGAGWLLARRAR